MAACPLPLFPLGRYYAFQDLRSLHVYPIRGILIMIGCCRSQETQQFPNSSLAVMTELYSKFDIPVSKPQRGANGKNGFVFLFEFLFEYIRFRRKFLHLTLVEGRHWSSRIREIRSGKVKQNPKAWRKETGGTSTLKNPNMNCLIHVPMTWQEKLVTQIWAIWIRRSNRSPLESRGWNAFPR